MNFYLCCFVNANNETCIIHVGCIYYMLLFNMYESPPWFNQLSVYILIPIDLSTGVEWHVIANIWKSFLFYYTGITGKMLNMPKYFTDYI